MVPGPASVRQHESLQPHIAPCPSWSPRSAPSPESTPLPTSTPARLLLRISFPPHPKLCGPGAPRSEPRAPLSSRLLVGRGLAGGSAPGAGCRDRPGLWEPRAAAAAAGTAVAAVAARAAAGAGGRGRGPGSAGPSAEPWAGLGPGPGARRWRRQWRGRCCCCCSLGPLLPPLATAGRAVSERRSAGAIPGRRWSWGAESGGRGRDCDLPGGTCELTWLGRRARYPIPVWRRRSVPCGAPRVRGVRVERTLSTLPLSPEPGSARWVP